MKRFVLSLICIVAIAFNINAQKINNVPPGTTSRLSNGWHKFVNQGASFDVEVLEHRLVQGNIVWFDRDKYSGTLAGYTISGKGTYTWNDNQRYEGSFRNNKRHGWGVMYYADGTKHNGKWKNHKKQGKGKAYDKNGNITQQGVWDEGVFIGAKKKKKKKKDS